MLHMWPTYATHFTRALYTTSDRVLFLDFLFLLAFLSPLFMSNTKNAITQCPHQDPTLSSTLSITNTSTEPFPQQQRLYVLTRQPLTARNLALHTSLVCQLVVIVADCI